MEKVDSQLLIVSFLLISLGFLVLYSASAPLALANFGNSFYYLGHQILFGFLPGILLSFLIFKLDPKKIKKYAPLILFFNLILLILVFFPPFGAKIRGGARWLKIGNFSFQPSEILKLTFTFYLASWLEGRIKKEEKKINQTFFFFILILIFISVFLLLQPDMSTLVIIFVISISLFFLSKTPLWQTFLILMMGFLAFLPLVKIAPYRMRRILSFLNPELDPLGISYHTKQAEIAIGSGEIFGKGLGFSQEKFGLLPHSFSDSIFAVFAEETGFLGASILIFLYLFLFWRIFKIGIEKKEVFSRLVCFGILSWFFAQTFVNISSMAGILPISGIPLPFLSYGGSHFLSEILGLAFLIKISKK